MASRPVKPRATRRADIVASVPLETARSMLDRRVQALHLLCEADLELGRRAEGGPARGGLRDGAHHVRVGVAQDERPPGADVVDVLRPVRAVEVRAFAARDEDGLAADGAEGAGRAVDAAWDEALGALEERSG